MPVLFRIRVRRYRMRQSTLKSVAQRILNAAGASSAELSLELVGDRRMRGLNREYRRRDYSTDVLAFPMREGSGPETPLLGDVVVSIDTAERQAKAGGWSLDEELVRLLTHGVLHLLGFDHERGRAEASRMRRKEQAVLRSLGRVPRLLTVIRHSSSV